MGVSEQTTVTPLIIELLCGTVVAAGCYSCFFDF